MAHGTLVDANVILDIISEDPVWASWSENALRVAADDGPLIINPIVFAEVSVRFPTIEELDAKLPTSDYVRAPLPWEAAFLAGKVQREYRRNGGSRASTLPDFFIGAHAAVAGLDLLTRDARRYRTYFPTLVITTPDTPQR